MTKRFTARLIGKIGLHATTLIYALIILAVIVSLDPILKFAGLEDVSESTPTWHITTMFKLTPFFLPAAIALEGLFTVCLPRLLKRHHDP